MTPLFFNNTLRILLLQPLHGQSVVTFSMPAVVTVACPKNQTTKNQTKRIKKIDKNGVVPFNTVVVTVVCPKNQTTKNQTKKKHKDRFN